jgi:hypothetical protein
MKWYIEKSVAFTVTISKYLSKAHITSPAHMILLGKRATALLPQLLNSPVSSSTMRAQKKRRAPYVAHQHSWIYTGFSLVPKNDKIYFRPE